MRRPAQPLRIEVALVPTHPGQVPRHAAEHRKVVYLTAALAPAEALLGLIGPEARAFANALIGRDRALDPSRSPALRTGRVGGASDRRDQA